MAATARTPESIKLAQMAAEALSRTASSNLGGYGKGVVPLQALAGLVGGVTEGYEQRQADAQRQAQQQLLAAALVEQAQGRLSPASRALLPAAALAGSSTPSTFGLGKSTTSDYLGRLGTVESGNNPTIQAKSSGATGQYQFIKSTWDGIRQEHPELGLTADGRTDPAQQQKAIVAFTNENASTLGRAGFETTPGNLYLAHFAGTGGAISALKADPSTPVANVLGQKAVDANPFLKGKTAGDLVNWANNKMAGVNPATTPPAVASAAPAAAAPSTGQGAPLTVTPTQAAATGIPVLANYTKNGVISDADLKRYNDDRQAYIDKVGAGGARPGPGEIPGATGGQASLSPDASVLAGNSGNDALGNPRPSKFPMALRGPAAQAPMSADASALLSPNATPTGLPPALMQGNGGPPTDRFFGTGDNIADGRAMNAGIDPGFDQGVGANGLVPTPAPIAPLPAPKPMPSPDIMQMDTGSGLQPLTPAAQALIPPAPPLQPSLDQALPAPTQLAGSALGPDADVPAGMENMLDQSTPPVAAIPQPVGGDMSTPSALAGTMAGNPLQTQPTLSAPPPPSPQPVAQPAIPTPQVVPPGTAPTSGLSPDASVLAGGAGQDTLAASPMFTRRYGNSDPGSAQNFNIQQAALQSPAAAALLPPSAQPALAPSTGAGASPVAAVVPPAAPGGSPTPSALTPNQNTMAQIVSAQQPQQSGIGSMFGGLFGGQQKASLNIPDVPGLGPAANAVLKDPNIDLATKREFLPASAKPVELQLVDTPDGKRAFNPQAGTLGPIIAPSTKSEDYTFHQLQDGSIVKENKRTGDVTPASAAPAGSGAFTGNTPEVQGINALVRDNRISKQQADDYLAGKVVVGPDGPHFIRPTDVFGNATPAAPGAPVGTPTNPLPQPSATTAPAGNQPTTPAASSSLGISLAGPKTEKLTADQTNAATYATRMQDAEKVLSNPTVSGALSDPSQAVKGAIPGVGNFLTSPQKQMADQAKLSFITAVLRKESGAAIGKDEYSTTDKQYFPQPGDSPDAVAQKSAARADAISSMGKAAGPAFTPSTVMPSMDAIRAEIARRAALKAN